MFIRHVVAATFFTLVSFAQMAQAQIVVDNDAGGPGYTETGSFQTTSNSTAGYNNGSYRFTRSTSPASAATWRPTIPTTGFYVVTTYFRRGADRSASVPYTINHADGSTVVTVDQTGAFSGDLGAVVLGAFRFTAGTSGNVVMSNVAGGSVVFIADTITFAADPGPVVSQTRNAPLYPQNGQAIFALARITDNTTVTAATVNWSASPAGTSGSAVARDNGLTQDGAANDETYGAQLPGFAAGQTVSYNFRAVDGSGNVTEGTTVSVLVGQVTSSTVRINELVASNSGSAFDLDFGDAGDWVELYNSGPDNADLTSHSLSDSLGTPDKWRFPAGTFVPANGYLLVFCDDANFAGDDLHTNFRLSASGETVVLTNANTGATVDQVTFPAMGSDEAYARFPNGSGAFTNTIITTPLAANQVGVRGAKPTFSLPSGLYSGTINVSISAPGATEIRYTTDGSEPVSTSTLYTSAVAISANTGLRAKAFYASVNPSLTQSASYFFTVHADRTIPVMNLIMKPGDLFDPATGIYANFNGRGEDWERPGYAVFMNPDGSQVRESNVGVRINGGTSRGAAKKSFRLYLRASYGETSWTLPWLTRTSAPSFTNLVLRGNNNDGILNASSVQLNQVTFFRDQMVRNWSGDSGAIGVDGFFFALYLNGQYWGLYNACERVTDDYMQAKQGGADWDVVKGTWNSTLKYHTEALDGDLVEWNNFIAWLDASDLATTTALDQLKQRIDYRGFLKYFALNIAAQNEDWPMNNWIATKRRGDPAAKWVFHENDAEWALGLRPQNYFSNTLTWARGSNFMTSPGHNNTIAPLSKLFNGNDLQANRLTNINGILDNPQGRLDFLSAFEEIMNFELNPTRSIADVNAYASLIQTEVPRESARWEPNMVYSAATFNAAWPNAVNNMRTFLTYRPDVIRNIVMTFFGVTGTRAVTFTKSGTGNGRMKIYDRTVTLPWTGLFFNGSMLNLEAVPDSGSSFAGYSGAVTTTSLAATFASTTGATTTINLSFNPASVTYVPNDVIINEYWVNDDSTSYPGIGLIHGDWIELLVTKAGTDLRGWRLTNNPTRTTQGAVDDGDGSLIFPNVAGLASLPAGTIVLVVSSTNTTNALTFATDDLDASDKRLILYRGNANLDSTTDPGFGVGTSNEAINLLAPGATSSFGDDIGIDFIAEGSTVTPLSFYGTSVGVPAFPNPFSGIGNDDGCIFTNSSGGGFNNDDGSDPNTSDAVAGPGGWIVDAPSTQTGDNPIGGPNILTPGSPNTGQSLSALYPAAVHDASLY